MIESEILNEPSLRNSTVSYASTTLVRPGGVIRTVSVCHAPTSPCAPEQPDAQAEITTASGHRFLMDFRIALTTPNVHASSTKLDFGLQMHVRDEPDSGTAPCGARYSTSPDLTATRHVPQLPARQPASIFTPFSSAKSSSDAHDGFQWCVLFDLPKVTVIFDSIIVSLAATAGAAFFTVAGPNASKCTFASGTPHAARPSVMLFMNAPGPQMK